MTVFKSITFTELMNRPDETPEQAYRRGYLQGYQRATYDAGSPTQMIHFWHSLTEWVRTNTEYFVAPPTMKD